ncbi:UvrD-helicase domain-containing protein [Natrarchaeobius chitinivorans]|uniref:DNA 3'-5' helicase n=1 Tax=Natrarchaeobius chitinivorans TaxID=1679083 RepID=A0A3N6MST1_NATCH|nr:UvrD-helicase domain-containing protein [Natrarchaeobius chitinivorans]RQG97826.1 PD-(D/E)XK nuclease family protein [Natrarchaeobius chitinivorans]
MGEDRRNDSTGEDRQNGSTGTDRRDDSTGESQNGSSANGERTPLEPKGSQRDVIDSRAACLSVDAGAGTGKTTTMLMRIERTIERGDVDPDDVLVLTFANEAAGSIRDAVAERLDPETAAAIDVHTYHSFCYRLVREYAYYLGYSPEFEVVTERNRRRLVGRLLAENEYDFASATHGDGSSTDVVESVDRFIRAMSQEDIAPETLRETLPDVRTLELLTEFVLWLERRAEEELTFDNEALRYFNEEVHLEAARESLVEYGKLISFCREKIAEAPAEFRDDDVVRDVDRYLRVLQRCVTNTIETLSLEEPTTKQLPRALFANEIWRTATGRLEQSPFGRLKHYVEFLRLARHYADVYADYHELLAAERALDFDELVRTATALVGGETGPGTAFVGSEDDPTQEAVAAEITGQWEQVYCDEFQDTDETQFSLIAALTDGPDRPDLLAIGDKDQAIYGWRGTDREGLDRLAGVYDDHESIELELNFRSRQEILDLTNHCSYGPQSSKTLREDGREPGTYAEVGSDHVGETPADRVVKVESDELEHSTAEQVSTTVSRLLNGESATVPQRSLADLAVIVRTNRQAQAVADALGDRQIPYEISGSPRGEIPPGVRTVLSYLRVLVDPDADAHLRRVLVYRYRLSEDDLATVQRAETTLYDAVFEVDLEALERPARLERAREHLAELERTRSVYPLSGFVRRFRELTRLEWFLTDEERTEFDRLERFAERTEADAAIHSLSEAFVDALERTLRGGESDRTRGTRSSDRVDVMTVHQAKGLEFDTVLVPFLSDEEWCVETDHARRARYRLLAAALEGEESPLLADLTADTVAEEWRVVHVALTRAENHLFVFGSGYDYDGSEDELGVSTAQQCLADDVEWSVAGKRMDLWSTLIDSFERVRETYPDTVADRTEEIARSADATPGTITYYADRPIEPLETSDAIETVHRLGGLVRDGTLLPAADAADAIALEGDDSDRAIRTPVGRHLSALTTETTRFPVQSLSTPNQLPAALRHSYTAMETHDTCSRKHYLDHVVRAIDDPLEATGPNRSEPPSVDEPDRPDSLEGGETSQRLVGTIFHAVAEEAFYRGYRGREEWREAAIRQLTARGLTGHREPILACIDRFFEASVSGIDRPIADWEAVAAEYPFSLADVSEVAGDVVGYVDSIRRLPPDGGVIGDDAAIGGSAGDLVVLDYKTSAERIGVDDATQLTLYARACNARFERPIAAAGYVHVGDPGPAVDLFDPDDLPPWSTVRETLEGVDDPSYEDTSPGEHCRFCPHRSLGCGPAEYSSH